MIAKTIDHTLLTATATEDDIRRLCAEAAEWSFATVCVNPLHVGLAAHELRGTEVKVCAVVGFPLGATTTAAKITETLGALEDGATEFDVVTALGLLRGGALGRYRDDLAAVVEVARRRPATVVKAILETGALSQDEIIIAAQAAVEVGVDFVKTSTGMVASGATVEAVRLLRATVLSQVRVKASGGIHTLAQARDMLSAGADRLGTSAGVAIAREEMSA